MPMKCSNADSSQMLAVLKILDLNPLKLNPWTQEHILIDPSVIRYFTFLDPVVHYFHSLPC